MKNVTQGITVVIVSYYSLDIIQGCLTSISEYTREYKGEVEIIIVDNANDDKFESNILRLIGSLNLTVRLINSSLNLGYGGGNNLGLNAASFDIVCIMNPDVRLIEPLFNDVAGIFQCNEDLCLVGCKQVSKKSRAIHIRPEYSIPLFKPVLSFLCNYFIDL